MACFDSQKTPIGGKGSLELVMDRALLIANPAASQFSGSIHRTAQRLLRRRYDLDVRWPTDADDARRITHQAVTDGVAMVVAMGGDGIVHHVAQPMVGSGATLGIVPVGTTNVIARLFKIPARPTAAVKLLASNHMVVPSPVMAVNLEVNGEPTLRFALFSAGLGVDAEVVLRAESEPYHKYRFGGLHYASTAVETVWSDLRHRSDEITVHFDDQEAIGIGLMAQIHPVLTYLGRTPLTIDPEIPDPLSTLLIERLPARRIPALLWGGWRGTLDKVKGLRLIRSHEVAATTNHRPLPAQLDGETIAGVGKLRMAVLPEALRIAAPQPSRR